MPPFTAPHDPDRLREALAPQAHWAAADHEGLTMLVRQLTAYAKAERDVAELPRDPCVAHWFAEADALQQQVLKQANLLAKETRNFKVREIAVSIVAVIKSDCSKTLDQAVLRLAATTHVTVGREHRLIRAALQVCLDLTTGERAPTQEAHPAAIAA